MSRASVAASDVWARCSSHPDDMGTHEYMANELRCVYCGAALPPVQCNGCGRFMSCEEIESNESRCGECA